MRNLRRIVRTGVLGMAAVATLTAGASVASASSLYVSTAGSDTTNCQSEGSPCKTIKYAIAQAEGTGQRNTIHVGPGTYSEALLLTKTGDGELTITGAGSNPSTGTTIAGGASSEILVYTAPPGNEITLSHLRLATSTTNSDPAIVAEGSLSAIDVAVAMQDASSEPPAVVASSGLLEHVTVEGVWLGKALEDNGSITLRDDRFITSASDTSEAAEIVGHPGSRTVIVQRSLFKQSNHSISSPQYGVEIIQANLTMDSSMVLGGQTALYLSTSESSSATISASTIDAGQPGISDGSPDTALQLLDSGATTVDSVALEGSIAAEQQMAIVSGGSQATITCGYSDVPSQAQEASASVGKIACANGVNGNTTTSPFSTLFADPSGTFSNPLADYQLSPLSSAVDSVPAGAISLPTIVPSTTDLAGNPRVVDGNGDCAAAQDKGALELQGHACPPPVEKQPLPTKPVAGSITNLSISPDAFYAAPSGATIAKTKKVKKAYGANVSYKDSQVAITRFTVMRATAGRTQGKSCKKPSKKNKHGKRCTLYKARGSFTRVDVAGLNRFHFSGRLNGQKLAKGSYKLQAVPHDAAGNGRAVSKQFKIK
ncbi:MAG TPA: hypothetical protein VFW38_00795 [Solirubrobacteraceae bacterium]|nr:hypothetical protein [Solirubrobacteraceae bacterium]